MIVNNPVLMTLNSDIDGLDAVHVLLIRLDRSVGVSGVRRAGVVCDGDEGSHTQHRMASMNPRVSPLVLPMPSQMGHAGGKVPLTQELFGATDAR